MIVERLGPLAAAARRPTGAADPRRRKFDRHRFRRGSGFRQGEFNVVLEAVATVPDAILTLVDGLRFRRGDVYQRDPEAAGHYDTDDHAITLFDRAFRSRREERAQRYDRPGPGFVPLAVFYVLHEIGHAIDLAPLRAAWRTFENAGQTAAAQAVLERARSRAGYRWALRGDVWEIVAGAGGSRFRTAAGGDRGTRITQYANRDWGEYYAESFALFMADPTLLERLRPSVYDTFARDFADPDRPPRPAPAAAPRQRRRRPAGVTRSARTAPPALAPPSRR